MLFNCLCCNCVGVNLVNDTLNTKPHGQVGKDFHNATVVCKRCALQHRQVLHKTVMNNILHDLVHGLAKMWCGNDPEDTAELGSGRWNKEPYLSCFPNTAGNDAIVTKEVDVVACCSHHFLPFSTFDGGKAIISYKPGKFVLGISKLQRYVTWASRRFWLQEDLTQYIGETIKRIAETEDVYVRLEGLVHGCEKFRGANAKNGNLTTEYRSGIFKEVK